MKTIALIAVAATALVGTHLVEPRVVSAPPGEPPSDAIVIFTGETLDGWTDSEQRPSRWKLIPGELAMTPDGGGNLFSKAKFRDCQLHIEFRTPSPAKGEGQNRGNSGIYFHGRYEVQVLDSFGSSTYPDGQCGSIYKMHEPLVNACRAPGEWQTYDIIFRAPRFDDSGKKTTSAVITVLHNGVLVQDHVKVDSPTGSAASNDESSAPGGIMLQDHQCAIAYRNIWYRPL